ncbi:capsular polysaccharide biosynthesis protein [Pukyongiella litopenaei]|uniref:Capsular polysaccharide biosynthesis protein n=1 Tax=Pukyongiella litopenaei TaxID=2605946 RepID=A0A2S0MTS7_9RHOB|nr:capsular polysaccharide biosynthesis protein [Pukyongiella litopenaei]AVO39131.1 capsular polysaccharide biosynthesis protein [Pukyongiella litopenaei]
MPGRERVGPTGHPRLFAYNGGFLNRRIRRILTLAGAPVRAGLPGPGDAVAVWGDSPTAWRGQAVAQRRGVPLWRIEDAFLRSLHPGRAGEPPLGLLIDRTGVHFDAAHPSDLETLLATHPLDETSMLGRARDAITRMREAHLSKYSGVDPGLPVPDPGYVLVVDQTRGDASVRASGGDRARFRAMLAAARDENPGARILIRTHPETASGFRPGHFDASDTGGDAMFSTDPVSPWHLVDGAVAVYTLSSQLGFEAILAGHRPRVFGQPFYAGWGLSVDETPLPRRGRTLTAAQLFAAAMILYPVWYDPYRDRLCDLESVLDTLDAQARAWREDRHGWVASGMRLWKRRPLQRFYGREKRVVFSDHPPRDTRRHMVWAGRAGPGQSDQAGQSGQSDQAGAVRVEDGFLRSRGLGAELVPPLSLVTDDLGIYYDPRQPSRLEALIAQRATLTPAQRTRAEALIAALTGVGLSKYNLGGTAPTLPAGRKVLVPGQVEDDASILTGTGAVSSNAGLLRAARAANPGAVLIYKPHPDVEAGLRRGAVDDLSAADLVATGADPAALLSQLDELWTMTSLMGFEALLRGVPVVTLGAPFYAGWGLTDDRGEVPARRTARPGLAGLVHAALIDYPRYFDPVTGQPCPVEVVVERLAAGAVAHPGLANRLLSKLQGIFASRADLWR